MNTIAYSSQAAHYARYRWDYVPQAVQTIFTTARLTPWAVVADVGAGTGLLTQHFAGRVEQVFAIEPDEKMRQMALVRLDGYSSCHLIDGHAEATTLPDHAVDLIAVGQALHWFDPKATRDEFRRILKPGGWLAVLQNHDIDDALRHALGQVLTAENGVDILYAARLPPKKPLDFYYGHTDFLRLTFPFVIQETWEEFLGSLLSRAYAPDVSHPRYPNLERAVRQVFDRFSANGRLQVRGVTELRLGQPAGSWAAGPALWPRGRFTGIS